MSTMKSFSSYVWHARLAHPSAQVLSQVLRSCSVPVLKDQLSNFCEPCKLGKIYSLPFSRSLSHVASPLSLVHTDV
ncbi:hypothetical protein Syun_009500 [Stephania yunnanensis]|uniref:GAG-pre-integrase domain-containing protein n=1 Tax=Stephania yunnanensis TaxID=152371 RepID=A0AAP0KEJ8_9MAGN